MRATAMRLTRPALAIAFVLAASACGEPASPTPTPPGTVLVDWTSSQRFHHGAFAQGERIGEDAEHVASMVVTNPYHPDEAYRAMLTVTYTVGERRMHAEDGTSFTARVPLHVRVVVDDARGWALQASCDYETETPTLSRFEHPPSAFFDRTFFWHTCRLAMQRPNSWATTPFRIFGNGEVGSDYEMFAFERRS